MTIRATLQDGRTVASGSATVLSTGPGNYAFTVTISELRKLEVVIEYKITTTPAQDPGSITNEVITNNVTGGTIVGIPAGGTIAITATGIGI